MLVLTRRENEEVVIGGGITIKIVKLTGGRVKLGITAPKTTSVNRAEVRICEPYVRISRDQ